MKSQSVHESLFVNIFVTPQVTPANSSRVSWGSRVGAQERMNLARAPSQPSVSLHHVSEACPEHLESSSLMRARGCVETERRHPVGKAGPHPAVLKLKLIRMVIKEL